MDQAGWSCDVGDDESLQVVQDGSGDEFGERTVVAVVGAVEGVEVAVAGSLEDDRRGPAEPDQQQVEQEPTGAAVAVEEGVDGFERAMQSSEAKRKFVDGQGTGRCVLPEFDGGVDPAVELAADLGPRGRRHAAAEQVEVVPPEAARSFLRVCLRVGGESQTALMATVWMCRISVTVIRPELSQSWAVCAWV